MNVGVVGLGSMGKRRIGILKKLRPDINIIGIDTRESRREEAAQCFGVETEDDLQNAIKKKGIGAVIVSTSPLSHGGIINAALKQGCHVFTEINLVKDGYEENLSLSREKGLVLFLSSTMMYRKEIQYVTKRVKEEKLPVNYIYHVGQYLPSWHVWENYKDFFVGDKRTNGCREAFAIELPWIVNAFGKITGFSGVCGRMTTLDIDYPDNYLLTVEHENGSRGSLCVDVASIEAVRNLEIYGQNIYLKWQGTPDTLYEYSEEAKKLLRIDLYESVKARNKNNNTIIENGYEDELVNFFEVIEKKAKAYHTFEKDGEILDLIDRIETEAAGEGQI